MLAEEHGCSATTSTLIKVDIVRRTAVLDENDETRVGAVDGIGQENEETIAKIAWLSKKEVPRAYGSMVVYLTKADDAGVLRKASSMLKESLDAPDHHSDCNESVPKCVLCEGLHESFSRNCKKLYPSQHE